MTSRVPVQHYNLRSNAFIVSPLHDLNTVDASPANIEGISDADRDTVSESGLDDDRDSNTVECMHDTYRNSLPLHSIGVEGDRPVTISPNLENSESSTGQYEILTIEDISPIESARARFLHIIVDHFINDHVVEVVDTESDYASQSAQDEMSKRKAIGVQYEGDPKFALPLMYVANLYETLVNEANIRLASLDGVRDKTIGVALEAAGGLYRRLAQRYPKRGHYTYKRRELATSLETRTRFPELVIQEEKRVRFVVVNGLAIVEKPNDVTIDDTEWFKRLTGRSEVAVSAGDYKFYSPRHKYRRVAMNSVTNIPGLPTFSASENSSTLSPGQLYRCMSDPENQQQTPSKHCVRQFTHQPQFHPIQAPHQSQPTSHYAHSHQCGPPSHLAEISPSNQSPTISQHIACLQTISGSHIRGHLHVLPSSPAKFCDECGAPYVRETSKYCSECGVKRLGT